MPAASTVILDAELIEQPTSDYASTGLSLIPSPTKITKFPYL